MACHPQVLLPNPNEVTRMDEEQDKIRHKAYQIWQEEGCPEGRSDVHWDMARE
ncbi:MAG: hypothetical protein B7X99_15870 [Rhizobiales bacterium 17-65-6]|nr:MAG: hypothetical protein B7X99_15870 [Rhizobiales bacterium 17-65-6]